MPRFGFAIDNRACIGCHACTVACKAEHNVPIGVNRTWVKYIEKGQFPDTRRSFNVQRCNHCADAPCVEICPVTSLYTRPDGIVDFDNDRCIGCKACMQACPYDALYLDPDSLTAAKCNYCTHRVDAGIEPACVVVCPVEAIVSGDLDDAGGRLAQLDRTQRVQYPKPEKATRPKLFYVGGETAALDPTAAPPGDEYLWSAGRGVTPRSIRLAEEEADEDARARRVYDQKRKPAPWGWMVSAYITTKALAAGIPIVAYILYVLRAIASPLPGRALVASLAFLALTGYFLVADLTQPRRFLYVLLRPQWKSWLVRGAYLITLFAALLPLTWLMGAVGAAPPAQALFGLVTSVAAIGVAGYTALLFAQARGRDYWQNPLLAIIMVADAIVAGMAACRLLGMMSWTGGMLLISTNAQVDPAGFATNADPARDAFLVALAVMLTLQLAELLPRHATKNAELAARLITQGPYAAWFWIGAIGVGLVAPAILLVLGGSIDAAALLMLAGIAAKNHVLVQAPQRVPLA